MTFLVKIDKIGGLDFGSEYNLARFRQWCKEHPGKELRIEEVVYKRSTKQNAFYWFYLGIIERETGNSSNELHEYLRRTLLSPKFIQVLGKEIKVPRSTSDLNKTEFGDYLDKICAETNVPIPDSEEYHKYTDEAPLN